jgi:hypothetical protein
MSEGPPVELETNGHKYNYGNFIPDDIYPKVHICEVSCETKGKKQVDFYNAQVASRKGMETTFGIL